MDKYLKALIFVVLLVYLNAAILYFINDNNNDVVISDVSPVDTPTKPSLSFDSGKDESLDEKKEVKKTKDGHEILDEFGRGKIEIDDFIFDQKNSYIKTVLVSFKSLKIQPKDYCWDEEVTETITVDVPKLTGMAVSDVLDDAKASGIKTPMKLPGNMNGKNLGELAGDEFEDFETITEEVTHYVTKCQTSDEIYLSSIFGVVDVLKNSASISRYTLSFKKEEKGDAKTDYLTVEKDIILPDEKGQYELRVVIWDKISGSKTQTIQEFMVD